MIILATPLDIPVSIDYTLPEIKGGEMMKLRKWIICKLAGRMGVCLNCTVVKGKHGAGVAYADLHGGMCKNLQFER